MFGNLGSDADLVVALYLLAINPTGFPGFGNGEALYLYGLAVGVSPLLVKL